MFGGRGNVQRHRRDSMEQDETEKTEIKEIKERIKKKEKELQEICERIELIEGERELDENIKKAKDIESFLSKSSTARKADYENEINLTTEDLDKAFRERELGEDGTRLYRFAMRTVAEENMRNRIFDVELNIYMSHVSKITIRKGIPKQRIVILLDEKNEPIFRWENKSISAKR